MEFERPKLEARRCAASGNGANVEESVAEVEQMSEADVEPAAGFFDIVRTSSSLPEKVRGEILPVRESELQGGTLDTH